MEIEAKSKEKNINLFCLSLEQNESALINCAKREMSFFGKCKRWDLSLKMIFLPLESPVFINLKKRCLNDRTHLFIRRRLLLFSFHQRLLWRFLLFFSFVHLTSLHFEQMKMKRTLCIANSWDKNGYPFIHSTISWRISFRWKCLWNTFTVERSWRCSRKMFFQDHQVLRRRK